AEGDDVAEAVELAAEIAGRLGEACDVAIEQVEDHAEEDEPASPGEVGIVGGAGNIQDLAGEDDGDKAANAVAQSQQGWQHSDFLHDELPGARVGDTVTIAGAETSCQRKVPRSQALPGNALPARLCLA